MALLCGHCTSLSGSSGMLRASAADSEVVHASPSRTEPLERVDVDASSPRDKVTGLRRIFRLRTASWVCFLVLMGIMCSVPAMMFQPHGHGGQNSMRMPPRWEPESNLSFRSWMQDLMLWTIVTDMTPPQQCAAIISQLGGAARDLARALTPAEVYNGGIVNGVQLDPVSYLLQGLQSKFAPLDEETRLGAAQDLLTFTRRQGETVDTLISRFELTRQRARDEGGGAVSIETGALLLLRACGVSSEQFQTLTQPFGLRLPNTEQEFTNMCHHLRRMGHIVERFPNNIASGLRSNAPAASSNAGHTYLAEADTGSSAESQMHWQSGAGATGGDWQMPYGDSADWAFAAYDVPGDFSDTESATSSDREEAFAVDDLQGMSASQADEYLFGQYQEAKRRWRRYTGKPVRALRRVLRRKGKGKGKGKAPRQGFLNIAELLRCPQRTSAQPPATAAPSAARGQQPEPSYTVQSASTGLHFAAFESDGSWAQVQTPRSIASSFRPAEPQPETAEATAGEAEHQLPQAAQNSGPAVHELSPDPWTQNPDPWMSWYQESAQRTSEHLPSLQTRRASWPTELSTQWQVPGIGNVGIPQSFNELLGISRQPPPPLPEQMSRQSSVPAWFSGMQHSMSQLQAAAAQRADHNSESNRPQQSPAVASVFARPTFQALRPVVAPQPSVQPSAARSNPLSMISQVQALRSTQHDRRSLPLSSDAAGVPQASSTPSQGTQHYHSHGVTCTICLDEFGPGDHVVRLTCGHTFHAICAGEMSMHNEVTAASDGLLYLECPNCRGMASVARDWHYPRLTAVRRTTDAQASSSDDAQPEPGEPASDAAPVAEPLSAPEGAMHDAPEGSAVPPDTPRAGSVATEEFSTPSAEASFPWWPVAPQPDADGIQPRISDDPPSQPSTSYHSNVRLADGRLGLLVDPGSYGNLVGELWLQSATAQTGKASEIQERSQPLQVGGVGKGAQMCINECRMPIALLREDGSAATGSFSSPVVQMSGCPALLGLRTLQQNNAILDMRTNQLHFAASDKVTIALPPGSETFQLEAAASGHLLLPCSAFEHVSAAAVQGEHHLFADNKAASEAVPAPSTGASTASTSMQLPSEFDYLLTNAELQLATSFEERSAAVLQNFSYEAAAGLVQEALVSWAAAARASDHQRFAHASGITRCFGLYSHGGEYGLTNATKAHPCFAQLLCKMMTEKGAQLPFTSIALSYDVAAPIHIDRFNKGTNMMLPLKVPRSGGGLWIELQKGSTVIGDIEIRKHGPTTYVGQNLPLCENQILTFDPKVPHATEPWTQGHRVVATAYVNGSTSKLTPSQSSALKELGFVLPGRQVTFASTESRATEPQIPARTESSATEPQIPTRTASSATEPQISAGSHDTDSAHLASGPTPEDISTRQVPLTRKANRASSQKMSFVKRVLLVSLFHSSVSAFMQAGWESVRVRPTELLRDSFDDLIYRVKRDDFQAMWVDLTDPRQFGGEERHSQVMSRLTVLMSWASVCPYAWLPCVVRCKPGTVHMYDIDLPRQPGSSKVRSSAECCVVAHIVAALEEALPSSAIPEPARPSDQICTTTSLLAQESHAAPSTGSSTGRQRQPQAVVSASMITASDPDAQSCPTAPRAEPEQTCAFPTDQKLQQKQRKQALKAKGMATMSTRHRKPVEQHHDDCGESLSSLNLEVTCLTWHSSSESEDERADDAAALTMPLLNSLTLWSLEGSACGQPPTPAPHSVLAVDVEEMFAILSCPDYRPCGIEVVELCGGRTPTSYLCVKRTLHSGSNFELIAGANFADDAVQHKVLSYLSSAQPLIVLMTPYCNSQQASPHNASRQGPSDARSSQLAHFCGKVALHQLQQGRYFLVEQPFPSSLYLCPPWPQVRDKPDVLRVVFDQCMIDQESGRAPAQRRVELLANCAEVLTPFANLRCDEGHQHISSQSCNGPQARALPYHMCTRLAFGLEGQHTLLLQLVPVMKVKSRKESASIHMHHPFTSTAQHVKIIEIVQTQVTPSAEPTQALRPSKALTQAERSAADMHDAIQPDPHAAASGARQMPLADDADDPQAPAAPAEARGRGPDIEPRVRRTWSEAAVQPEAGADWTSFDVQTCIRGLRHGTEADRRRILRKLHLRWFHCSSDRMQRLLRAAGLPKDVCDLVPAINDTCRVCQHWARPATETKASNRMVLGFNIEVEGDIMFCKLRGVQHAILVLVDRGVRWTSVGLLPSRQTTDLLSSIDRTWIAIFGPMQVLVFDGESGLDDDESSAYFAMRGITKRTSAPNQHTRIADRKIAILRDTIHKIGTQLQEEGMTIPFERIMYDAAFALNALTSINGCSPYVAVMGRQPALLPADDMALPDAVPDIMSRHTHRLREVAVQAIAEGTARERLKRALKTPTKPAAEEFEFKVGQPVDYWREPVSKDVSGWRGPATITDLTRLSHGRIGVRTSADQMITCRVQDVRPSLTYLSEELSAFFGVPDFASPVHSQAGQAQQHAQAVVDALRTGTVLSLGHIRTADGTWVETPTTPHHRATYQACMFLAETVFNLESVTAVRLAKGVRTLTHREEFSMTLSLWWTTHGSRQIEFIHADSSKMSIVDLCGQEWNNVRIIQFLCVPGAEEWATSQRWSEPPILDQGQDAEGAPDTDQASRLSTIQEGSTEDGSSEAPAEAAISMHALCEMFGDSIPPQHVQALREAYAAVTTEPAPTTVERDSLKALRAADCQTCDPSAEVPAWSDANMPEACYLLTEEQLSTALADCSNEYVALDADDTGAYVALEAYGDACKLVEGLSRLPNADEHVEIRMYESHTRKAVIERSDDILTADEQREYATAVTEAIVRELKTWEGYKCFARRPRAEAPCVIDVRWVFKWKIIKGVRTIRARLCLRGFKETGADDQSNYAATAARFSQRLIASEGALRQWVIASADVPKAFLQGVSYKELSEETGRPMRDVSFELTGEALRCLQHLPMFKGFDARHEVLHCLKPGTGCRDAPKCFSIKLKKVTASFGLVSSSVDAELEFLFDDGNRLQMVLVKHVDDLKMIGAKETITRFVQHLSATFGPMEIEWGSFTFCGVKHTQRDDMSISLDQMKFLSACKPIVQPAALSGGPEQLLPEGARRHFLSLLMTLAYGLLTRPDISVFIAALQRESHQAKVIHVKRLNLLLKWVQANPRCLNYPVMPYPDMLLQISDAAFKAKATDGLSMRGLISVRVNSADVESGKQNIQCHLVDFASKQQRHVTRSTFSSELFAATDATDAGLVNTVTIHEMNNGVLSFCDARHVIEGSKPCSVLLGLVLDARSVTAATVAAHVKVPAEPSLLLHVCWIRNLLQTKRLHRLYWSDTRSMTADGMTKGSVGREQIMSAMSGELQILQPYEIQQLQLGVGFEKLEQEEGLRVHKVCSESRSEKRHNYIDHNGLLRGHKLLPGDFVVMVNGKSSRTEMMEELRSGRTVFAAPAEGAVPVIWRFPENLPALEAPPMAQPSVTCADQPRAEVSWQAPAVEHFAPEEDHPPSPPPGLVQRDERPPVAERSTEVPGGTPPEPAQATSSAAAPEPWDEQPEKANSSAAAPEPWEEVPQGSRLEPVQEADGSPQESDPDGYLPPPWAAEERVKRAVTEALHDPVNLAESAQQRPSTSTETFPAEAANGASHRQEHVDNSDVKELVAIVAYDAVEPSKGYLPCEPGDRILCKLEFIAPAEEGSSYACDYIYGWPIGEPDHAGGWLPVDCVRTLGNDAVTVT
ncbi:RE1 [Symbiodinium sp. CCMP2592]|nr:RE1 [Symbiodinium sp. CCMP2592]